MLDPAYRSLVSDPTAQPHVNLGDLEHGDVLTLEALTEFFQATLVTRNRLELGSPWLCKVENLPPLGVYAGDIHLQGVRSLNWSLLEIGDAACIDAGMWLGRIVQNFPVMISTAAQRLLCPVPPITHAWVNGVKAF